MDAKADDYGNNVSRQGAKAQRLGIGKMSLRLTRLRTVIITNSFLLILFLRAFAPLREAWPSGRSARPTSPSLCSFFRIGNRQELLHFGPVVQTPNGHGPIEASRCDAMR